MEFKTSRIEDEWNSNKLSALLKQIVNDAAAHAKEKFDWDFVLTSIFRTAQEDAELHASGIHTFWRAVDVRTKDQEQAAVNGVADFINNKYIYDPHRPGMKVCFKEPHGNNVHAHFQIHANTRLRKQDSAQPATVTEHAAPVTEHSAPVTEHAAPVTEPAHAEPAGVEDSVKVPFCGKALPLDQNGIAEILDRLGVKAAELWAVIDVETYGYGFIPDRRPLILFERHKFSKFTNRKFDGSNPDISNRKAGGYGKGGAPQYLKLNRAVALDRSAALRSASWGIGQVMGMNFEIAGYADVEQMVTAMMTSENDQLNAMANYIIVNKLDKAMRAHDWATFARGYNGENYAINKYDTRLAAAHNRRRILLPDLTLRAAQVYLTYLGYDAGAIDGLPGQRTSNALNHFYDDNNLSLPTEVNEEVLTALKEKIAAKG
jgi:hypothetical protein